MGYKMEEWGKDHWSLLAYLETCQVDAEGGTAQYHIGRLSCNNKKPVGSGAPMARPVWDDKYSTRLKGGVMAEAGYDDFDCLNDLEDEGLLLQLSSIINGIFRLTPKGIALAGEIRVHKAGGGVFSNFVPQGVK